MKKKYRNIVVDGIKYAWSIKCVDEELGFTYVNLWKDKQIIYVMSFWEEEICPKKIAGIIKYYEGEKLRGTEQRIQADC